MSDLDTIEKTLRDFMKERGDDYDDRASEDDDDEGDWTQWSNIDWMATYQRWAESGGQSEPPDIRVWARPNGEFQTWGKSPDGYPHYGRGMWIPSTPEEIAIYKTHDKWHDSLLKFYKELPLEEREYVLVPGLGRVEVAKEFGGEGQGDRYYIIFRVTEDNGNIRYFKIDGWYASYDGGHYDGPFSEVKPVEKTVTFYE